MFQSYSAQGAIVITMQKMTLPISYFYLLLIFLYLVDMKEKKYRSLKND